GRGVGAIMTEEAAQRGMSLGGWEARPAAAIESAEIQSLILGGLGFLPQGLALLCGITDDRAAAKAWLAELLPHIRFSDGRAWPAATILGLTASGLQKLGLPDDSMATFPAAFIDGMAAPWRARGFGGGGAKRPAAGGRG